MLFVCPKCKGKLNIIASSAVCDEGHSYDRSKKGYYNLHLSNRSGNHGDNKRMVEARREFLNGEFYKPLAVKMSKIISQTAPLGASVLDIGCGEGYYTDYIEKALSERDGESHVFGFDISKDAVQRVARRNRNIGIAVASAYDMPIADGSVDVAVNMFSPLAISEIHRVLKDDGYLVMAIPGVEHLFGLKEILYENPYKNGVNDTHIEGFELVLSDAVTYRLILERNDDIKNLFNMTPYAYRTGKDGREMLESLTRLETTVDFITFVYKKCKNNGFNSETNKAYI